MESRRGVHGDKALALLQGQAQQHPSVGQGWGWDAMETPTLGLWSVPASPRSHPMSSGAGPAWKGRMSLEGQAGAGDILP